LLKIDFFFSFIDLTTGEPEGDYVVSHQKLFSKTFQIQRNINV